MKRICSFIVCLLAVLGVSAQGIDFFHGSYDEALQKAQKENKCIFIDVYTSWCGPCRMMATQVFPLPEVGDFYNSHFVCLKLDAEKEKEHGFFKQYKASAFPTYFWLDAKGNLLDTKTGTASPENFIQYGKDAQNSNLYATLEAGKKRWDSGERSLELVDTYVLGVLAKVHPEQVKPCLLDYFSTLSEEDLQKKENYQLMKGFMRGFEDNLVSRSLLKYADVYKGYERGNDYWINMYRMIVRLGSIVRDKPQQYEAHLALLKSIDSPYVDMYVNLLDIEKKLFAKDFQQGINQAISLVEANPSHGYLYGQLYYTLIIAGFFDGSVQSDEIKQLAVNLADKALEATPCKETLLYLASAYANMGDYKKAYELLASEPFFPTPMLSNALYSKLHLPVIHRKYLK